MALYNETLGSMEWDNLINSSDFPIITGLRTIAPGQGELKRGTALALSGGTAGTGKLVVLGTAAAENETLTPCCILCDGVDATGEVKAQVYLSGHFNRNALLTKDGGAITDEQAEELRKGGIYLDNMMKK